MFAIFSHPLDQWKLWLSQRETATCCADALQHLTLSDAMEQPHIYPVTLQQWDERGALLHLAAEAMPANGQHAALLLFWDQEDRQLRLEGQVRMQEMKPRGGLLCLTPITVEFWQGARFRLHDRIEYRYQQTSDQWQTRRLYP